MGTIFAIQPVRGPLVADVWWPSNRVRSSASSEQRPSQERWFSKMPRRCEAVLLSCWQSLNLLLEFGCLRGSTLTWRIEDALDRASSVGVTVPRPREVRDYLLRYPDIADAVGSVCDMAAERLGPGTRLSLDVYRDPEIDDEYLTLYVRQDGYDQRLLDAIEDLCEVCESELVGKSGWLLVTTDFAPPM